MIYQILFKVTYRSFYIKEACPNYGQECTMFSRMIHSLTFKEHSCTKVSESSLLIPQFDRSRNSSFLFHKLDFQECHVFSIISFPIHIAGQNFQEHRGYARIRNCLLDMVPAHIPEIATVETRNSVETRRCIRGLLFSR